MHQRVERVAVVISLRIDRVEHFLLDRRCDDLPDQLRDQYLSLDRFEIASIRSATDAFPSMADPLFRLDRSRRSHFGEENQDSLHGKQLQIYGVTTP